MIRPHQTITKIPDNKPDALPELWNSRYREIDANEAALDAAIEAARTDIEGLDPDMQNALIAQLLVAMDAGGLAMREIERFKNVRFQEGETVIYNRGVISGCSVSASSAAARNLDIAGGKFFAHGREFSLSNSENVAAVPGNPGAQSMTCYAYLMIDGDGIVQCNCTGLGEDLPENGTEVARITVPAGNTEATDPNLAGVTITDTRRQEPLWPLIAQNPAWVSIALDYMLPDASYLVYSEVVSFEGGTYQLGDLQAQDKLTNGFKLLLTGTADVVLVRYLVSRIGI